MFDYVICKYKLPKVDLQGTSLTQKDLKTLEYQTTDLDQALYQYTIERDGRVSYQYYSIAEFVKDESSSTGTRLEQKPEVRYLTGDHIIRFGTFHLLDTGDNSLIISWKALVLDGVVSKITLNELKLVPNEEYKQQKIDLQKGVEEYDKLQAQPYYKYFIRPFNKYKRKLIIKIATAIHNTSNWICLNLYKL